MCRTYIYSVTVWPYSRLLCRTYSHTLVRVYISQNSSGGGYVHLPGQSGTRLTAYHIYGMWLVLSNAWPPLPHTVALSNWSTVAEPPELFRLECASPCYTADTNSTHSKRNNPLVYRVSARCNHGSTGSKQVYLAWRRVYSRTTAHQFLIHSILNIITNRFKFKVINKHCLKQQAKHACQVHSGRKLTRDYTRREGWHHTQSIVWRHSGGLLPAGDGSHSTDQPNGTEVGHAGLSVGFSRVIPEKQTSKTEYTNT
jgi:hypothetical protein